MSDIWQTLADHRAATKDTPLAALFDQDAQRFTGFSAEADGLLMDYSKTALDGTARDLLLELAHRCDLQGKIDAMMSGAKINTTEGRAVLHTALRAPADAVIEVDGENVVPGIHEVLTRMGGFATALRDGSYSTKSGAAFTDVVNIGIGGSDLGPVMATLALAPYHDGPACHFVSNVDGAHIHDVLAGLNPETTLIVIASKTFTTIETMTNAQTAITWLQASLGEDVSGHLAAVSTAMDKTAAMGIPDARVFGFADWVGGRYSLWGPIGLPIMIAVGPENFRAFLDGAAAMDAHFRAAPLAEKVVELVEGGSANFGPLYPDEMPLFEKIETIAKRIYRADEVLADNKIRNQLKEWEDAGYGHLPVCMAKTQYSFSTDPNLRGAPTGHSVPVREVRLSAGAGFIVVVCGEIMTMPGLPRTPASESIRLNEEGLIEGLF